MKKCFKGFTLVECIVALAILGIASLTMAQIYASVSQRNKNNHLVNTSLSNQMAYVEKYTDTEAVPIYFNEASGTSKPDPQSLSSSTTKYPPHKESGSVTVKSNYVTIVKVKTDSHLEANDTYSFPVDTFILRSRDRNDKDAKDTGYVGEAEDNYNLRYKYIVGHTN